MGQGWVVGLGEVLWDVFGDEARFGGAPANFACHASQLGARVAMVSAVGPESDPLAQRALQELSDHGVDTSAISRSQHETGRVLVEVDAEGHPEYRFAEHPAWDFLAWSQAAETIAAQTHAVGFGTLAQRKSDSQRTIRQFLAAVPEEAWRIFDVNLRGDFWTEQCVVESLRLANALKLNSDELPIVARACGVQASGNEALEKIREMFALRLVAFTGGSGGATLVTADESDHCAAPKVQVVDTVGAGDSYTAAMTLGLLKGWPLSEVNQRAIAVAAYVCTQRGATPPLPQGIKDWFAQP